MGALTPGWRLGAVVREAVANTVSSTARLTVLGLGLAGMMGALFWAELSFTRDVRQEIRRFDAAGARVAVVDGPNGIDAAACNRLRWSSHIVAAGGYRVAEQVESATSPRVAFAQWEIVAEVVRVWDEDAPLSPPSGYVVGIAAAREIGLTDGSLLQIADEEGIPVTVIDPGARNEAATRTIMSPVAPDGRLSQCWVEFEPGSYEAGLSWLSAYFAADEAEVRRAVTRGQFGLDPAVTLANRPQRWGWLPVGLAGAAVITLMAIFRRADTALYRAFGVRRIAVLVMHQSETWIVVLGSLVVGLLWALTAYSLASGIPSGDQILLASRTVFIAAAVVVLFGPLGAVIAGSGSPADLLKER